MTRTVHSNLLADCCANRARTPFLLALLLSPTASTLEYLLVEYNNSIGAADGAAHDGRMRLVDADRAAVLGELREHGGGVVIRRLEEGLARKAELARVAAAAAVALEKDKADLAGRAVIDAAMAAALQEEYTRENLEDDGGSHSALVADIVAALFHACTMGFELTVRALLGFPGLVDLLPDADAHRALAVAVAGVPNAYPGCQLSWRRAGRRVCVQRRHRTLPGRCLTPYCRTSALRVPRRDAEDRQNV